MVAAAAAEGDVHKECMGLDMCKRGSEEGMVRSAKRRCGVVFSAEDD
jgi:hypothetical protein